MLLFGWYQKQTKKTAIYPRDKALEYLTLGLTGEAGEVAGKVKKVLRDQGGTLSDKNIEDLQAELGDVLWYISELCNLLNLKLEDVASENVKKLLDRQQRNKLGGSGDKR